MSSPRPLRVYPQPDSRRREIILELLSTERSYVACLNAFFSTYVWHLSTQKYVPMPTQFTQLVQNLEIVRQLHAQFYDELLSHISIESWESESEISPLFKKFAPFFRIYGDVIPHVEVVGNLLQDLSVDYPSLSDMLHSCREDPRCNRNTFQSFLIMPAQRIPRYVLLLKNLLDHTPTDHVERHSLQEVVDLLYDVLQQINQAALNECNRKVLAKIHKKMPKSFDVFNPRRKFLMKAGMLLISSDQSVQNVKIFLFNDALLIVKTFMGHYRIVKKFDFTSSSISVFEENISAKASQHLNGVLDSYRIILVDTDSVSWILQCSNSATKRKCIDMVRKCLANVSNIRSSDIVPKRRASCI